MHAALGGKHGHVAVARARPRDPLLVPLRPAADRRQRALARARPEPEHGAPLRRDAREARLPAAGPRLEALPARPEGARPRLLGDQLDGPARDLRPAPAAAQRRDAATRSTWRSSTAPTSSTSSAAARPGPASGRSTSTSTSARGCRPTARRWGRRSSPSFPRIASRRSSSDRLRAARAEHAHRPRRVPRGARADPRVGHRGQRRGARLRAALDRRADPLALGRGASPRSTSPSTARWSSMDELIARYGPAVTQAARDISLEHGAQAGARLMAARSTTTPASSGRRRPTCGRRPRSGATSPGSSASAGSRSPTTTSCGAGRSTT